MFTQELHTQPRTIQIEKIFQDNRESIKADLDSLDLSLRDIAAKYKVNDRNVRRWAERLGIDANARTVERRRVNADGPKCRARRKRQEDAVASPKLLSMKW